MEIDQDARRTALKPLDALVGEWSIEASMAPGVAGRAVFEWILDGQFLMQRSGVPEMEGPPDTTAIIGVDLAGEAYTQHYFDSRGVARLYAMTLADGVWELRRTSPDFTPLDFAQRFIGEFSDDGTTIEGRWETSKDGSTWELDFGLTYTKVT